MKAPATSALLAVLMSALMGALPVADGVHELNEAARKALDEERPADAVQLLEKANRIAPEDEVVVRNLAYAYFKRGKQHLAGHRHGTAAADYRKAMQLYPGETGYGLHLAQLLLQRYQLVQCEDVLRDLLDAEPVEPAGEDTEEVDKGPIWLMLGDCLNLSDRLAEADDAYRQAATSSDAGTARLAQAAAERNGRQLEVERDYVTDTTPSFILRYPASSSGPTYGVRLVNVLEAARAEVCANLDYFPRQKITVVLYPPDEFRAATGTHDWVAGLFDRKIRLPIADVDGDVKAIQAAFRHEFTHLIVSEIDPRCPTFVNEGLAQVLEHGRGKGMERLIADLDRRGGRKSLPRIEDLPATFVEIQDADEVRRAYLLSYAFVDHVVRHHGMGAVLAWMRELNGHPLDEAYQRAVGRSLTREEAQFRQLVGSAR